LNYLASRFLNNKKRSQDHGGKMIFNDLATIILPVVFLNNEKAFARSWWQDDF